MWRRCESLRWFKGVRRWFEWVPENSSTASSISTMDPCGTRLHRYSPSLDFYASMSGTYYNFGYELPSWLAPFIGIGLPLIQFKLREERQDSEIDTVPPLLGLRMGIPPSSRRTRPTSSRPLQ